MKKNKERATPKAQLKSFADMIAPSVIMFLTDHYICGNTYRCVFALREYPTSTTEQAILRRLGEKDGVTLHIYARQVKYVEEKKILDNAANKNRMYASADNMKETIKAQNNLQDVADVLSNMQRNREPLIPLETPLPLLMSCTCF